jgi:hypothetical protein
MISRQDQDFKFSRKVTDPILQKTIQPFPLRASAYLRSIHVSVSNNQSFKYSYQAIPLP